MAAIEVRGRSDNVLNDTKDIIEYVINREAMPAHTILHIVLNFRDHGGNIIQSLALRHSNTRTTVCDDADLDNWDRRVEVEIEPTA
jgi:hypothetical protein